LSPGGKSSGDGFVRGLLAGAILAVLLLITIGPLREALLPDDGSRSDEALGVIDEAYFRAVDDTELEDASVEGMVRRLRRENEDRFSHYFDEEAYERFQNSASGEFSGIGTTVSEVNRGLRIARVFEGTPAEEAGLEAGDLIIGVGDESLAGVSSTDASALIKGPPGTEVELTVEDAENGKERELSIERAQVKIPAVTGEIRREDGRKIAYVTLASFTRGAHAELREEIEGLYRKGAEGLVLDLRGNGGGLLQEAILIASIFQEDGPIVITEGRTRPREVFDAEGDALETRPMAVLTNRDTASASEIVTAALQQNDLATVVGTRTFGKGTFQEVIELDGGAALDLTVGEYLTADGTSILNKGVTPDIKVRQDDPEAARDLALRRALGIVAGEIPADGS
jgi:carboxyl-terminal processing protease